MTTTLILIWRLRSGKLQVVAPPEPAQTLTSPRFEPGSIVRVVADRTPGVHPMHAEGILVALQKAKVIAPEVVKKKSVWCRQLMQQVRRLSHLNFISSFPLPLFLSLSSAPSLSLSFLLSLSLSLLYFFLPILSFSLSLNPKHAHTHKMTKRASPSPPTRMRATTASRHVARTFSGKPDVMMDQYNLPEHITPPCSLRRFTFFKDRNKLAGEMDRRQHAYNIPVLLPAEILSYLLQASKRQ